MKVFWRAPKCEHSRGDVKDTTWTGRACHTLVMSKFVLISPARNRDVTETLAKHLGPRSSHHNPVLWRYFKHRPTNLCASASWAPRHCTPFLLTKGTLYSHRMVSGILAVKAHTVAYPRENLFNLMFSYSCLWVFHATFAQTRMVSYH